MKRKAYRFLSGRSSLGFSIFWSLDSIQSMLGLVALGRKWQNNRTSQSLPAVLGNPGLAQDDILHCHSTRKGEVAAVAAAGLLRNAVATHASLLGLRVVQRQSPGVWPAARQPSTRAPWLVSLPWP